MEPRAARARAAIVSRAQAANIFGTNKVVKKYHFTETRGANLTDENGIMLQCAAPSVNGSLTAADGGALATKNADMTVSGGALTTNAGATVKTMATGMTVGGGGNQWQRDIEGLSAPSLNLTALNYSDFSINMTPMPHDRRLVEAVHELTSGKVPRHAAGRRPCGHRAESYSTLATRF